MWFVRLSSVIQLNLKCQNKMKSEHPEKMSHNVWPKRNRKMTKTTVVRIVVLIILKIVHRLNSIRRELLFKFLFFSEIRFGNVRNGLKINLETSFSKDLKHGVIV